MDIAYLIMGHTFYLTCGGLLGFKSDYTGKDRWVKKAISIVLCNIREAMSSSADSFSGWDLTLCYKSGNCMMIVDFDFWQLDLYRCQGEDSLPENT